jgi:superfamily I DNA/RNA helicase
MRLIPNYINPSNSSNAEKKIFKKFSENKSLDNWVCLHSLGLSNHSTKREGEIDFLLVGPLGVFALEVKGGRISRKNGGWYFIDRYGRANKKKESPFNQARTALYSIRSDITERFGHELYSNVFGYGVVLPDIEFQEESPEWDNNIIFDKNDVKLDISSYIERLAEYWQKKQKSRKLLTKKQIHEITNYLRGDFEIVKSISASVDESEQEIIDITQEQYSLLDSLELNPRTVFLGSAGTGKTLMAIEKARRNAYKGINTLFLCFNRLLADFVAESLEKELGEHSKYVEVASLHSIIHKFIKKADKQELLKSASGSELFENLYPEVFLSIDNIDTYQEVIIDEAQDILTDKFIKVIDRLVEGGLDKGHWLICMDQENQDIYKRKDSDAIQKLLSSGSTFKLTINCRNTKSIAQQAKLVSMIDAGTTVKASGTPVKYLWYENEADQADKVSDEINKLIAEGIHREDITVLSPARLSKSCAGSGRLRVDAPLFNIDTRTTALTINGHIGYTTIASFKGLENKVIVLTDLRSIDDIDSVINYVGCTRARSHLVISLPKYIKKELNSRVSNIIETK